MAVTKERRHERIRLVTREYIEKKYVRKKDKICLVCHEPCCGTVCKECFKHRGNHGRYNISVI
jgi:hypothetical protein